MKIEKLMNLPCYVTSINVVCGILSIFSSIAGLLDLAAILLVLAVVADFFDGKIARITKTVSEFGKQMDSLSDIVSFGIAPAVFAFAINSSLFAIFVYILFIFAGILRLARYNITKMKGIYEGTPITWSGIIIPVLYLINVPYFVYPIALLIYAILMISSFKIKKVIG